MARPAITVDESIGKIKILRRKVFGRCNEVIIMFFINDNLFKLL